MVRLLRKYHKWLMAFVGLQFLIWSVTGVYMVTLDIHYIHGESMVKNQNQTVDLSEVSYSFHQLRADFPGARNIELNNWMQIPVYRFIDADNSNKVINARNGQSIPQIDRGQASQVARYYYAGNHDITSVRLIEGLVELPSELSPRHLPVWQVVFDGFSAPTFYISKDSGEVVTKRHDFWRLFDWMWRFHIMDYDDGENVANWWLLLVASLALTAALAGAFLTYQTLIKPVRGRV